jgi:hypothetical protein
MNMLKLSPLALVLMAIASLAHAQDATPAWQAPGYVMEEILVTAKAPISFDSDDIDLSTAAAPELYMQEPVVNARVPSRHARFIDHEIRRGYRGS